MFVCLLHVSAYLSTCIYKCVCAHACVCCYCYQWAICVLWLREALFGDSVDCVTLLLLCLMQQTIRVEMLADRHVSQLCLLHAKDL